MSYQKDARGFVRVVGPGACVAETDNAKKPQIGLGGKSSKGRVMAFKLDCNICGEELGWSSSRAKRLASSRGRV